MPYATMIIALAGILAWSRILYLSRKNNEPLYKCLYAVLALLWSITIMAVVIPGVIFDMAPNIMPVFIQGGIFLLIICIVEITRKKCMNG